MKHIFKFSSKRTAGGHPNSGCDTTALHDLNINPNAVNTIDMNYFFTAAELGIRSGGASGDNRYIDWRTNIGMCAHAIQQFATAATGLLVTGDKYIDNDPEVNALLSNMIYRMLERMSLRYSNKPLKVVLQQARTLTCARLPG